MLEKYKRLVRTLYISLAIAVVDQVSKLWILSLFSNSEFRGYEIVPFLNIVLVWNFGVSFGFLNEASQSQIILILVSLVIIGSLIYWLTKSQDLRIRYPVALIIGGAFGNVVDRILYGAVVDFIDFHIKTHHFPAFNFADSCIVIGVFILILQAIQESDARQRRS